MKTQGSSKDLDFNNFIDAETLFNVIKSKWIRFENVGTNQMKFKSNLNSVSIGVNKSDQLLSRKDNITKFHNCQEEVIKLYNKYFKMIHKAVFDAKYGKGLKMLTPK